MAKAEKVVIVEPGDAEEETKRPGDEEDDEDEDDDEDGDQPQGEGDPDEDEEEGDESDYDQIANRNRRTAKAMSDTKTNSNAAGKEATELTYMEADEFVKSLTEGLSEIVSDVHGKKAIRRIVAEEIAKALSPLGSRMETIEKATANISDVVEEMTGAQDELMKALSDKTDTLAKSAVEKKAAIAKGAAATKTEKTVTTEKGDVLEKANVADPEEANTENRSTLVKAHTLYDEAVELRNRYGEPIDGLNSDYTLNLNKGKADAGAVARLEKGLDTFKKRVGLAA